jgi:PAS domain S-box-containing protein
MTGIAGSASSGVPLDGGDARRAAHFQALVESSEDAILSKDVRGVITSWNPAAERLYGYSAEEAVGKSIGLIIPEDHAGDEQEILGRVLAGEQIAHYETDRVRKDGRRVSVSLTVSPIRGPEAEIVGASVVARDIGERLEREERAARLQEITSALAREADPGQAIGVLVRDGLEALGADAATLGLLDAAGERVVLADDVGHSREGLAGWQSFPLDAGLPMSVAIRTLTPIWSPTAEDVCERFPALAGERFKFAALAVLPLVVEGRAIGAVSFSFAKPRRFGAEEKAFAGSIVQQVAYALERARTHDAEHRARRRLAFLARASEALNESLEVQLTLERLADLAVRHVSDWCIVDLARPYGGVDDAIIAHVDRSKVELAEELRRRYPPDPDATSG